MVSKFAVELCYRPRIEIQHVWCVRASALFTFIFRAVTAADWGRSSEYEVGLVLL
jgi:hypothetical protein